jgi:hypothetical protein
MNNRKRTISKIKLRSTNKRKKWLERRLRLVRENSLYGVDGLTEQELLDKKG